MRTAPVTSRSLWAAVLALVLTMRLLTPVGFMPSFDGGKLTIVECPGGDRAPMPDMPGMHHDHGKTCQSCPHATASGGGLVDAQSFALVSAIPLAAPLLLGHSLSLPARSSDHDRPPAIGPPLPA